MNAEININGKKFAVVDELPNESLYLCIDADGEHSIQYSGDVATLRIGD
jgi:hypothetical protein